MRHGGRLAVELSDLQVNLLDLQGNTLAALRNEYLERKTGQWYSLP